MTYTYKEYFKPIFYKEILEIYEYGNIQCVFTETSTSFDTTRKGSMIEILEFTHQKYYSQLHRLVGTGESFRNNPLLEKQYNNFRSKYLRWRYKELIK